jgi:putative oxidoreductase
MTSTARAAHPARYGWLALRVGLAFVFGYAGVMKLLDPTAFAVEIDHYQFLPSLAPWLAATLPAVEVTLALALLAAPSAWRRAAALGCFALMGMFTVAASAALYRKLDIDCGCFGTGTGPISWLTLVRDAALLAVSALLARFA